MSRLCIHLSLLIPLVVALSGRWWFWMALILLCCGLVAVFAFPKSPTQYLFPATDAYSAFIVDSMMKADQAYTLETLALARAHQIPAHDVIEILQSRLVREVK